MTARRRKAGPLGGVLRVMHTDELAALAVEARWHTAASLLVLPMLLLGMVTMAVVVFAAMEMGLAAARRGVPALSARRAQPS